MPTKQRARRHSARTAVQHRTFWIYNGAALGLTLLLALLARAIPSFAEGYARYVYPLFVQTIGRLWSAVPFSLFELLIVTAVLYVLIGLVLLIVHLIRRQQERARTVGAAARRVVSIVMTLVLLFTLTGGINYHRSPFSAFSGLTVRGVSVEDLKALCTLLRDDLSEEATQMETDSDGVSVLTCDVNAAARTAMTALGETYPELSGFYPNPKKICCSIVMSYTNISGIYSPFTVEANYNRLITPYNIPLTVCHELSHLRGFMREDEANFIAYLACIGSTENEFRYSGSMLAFLYATNALWNAGESELYKQLFDSLPQVVQKDYQANNDYWKQFETPIAEVSNKVNDAYLKANAQEDGVKSYGRMVDLLVAYYIPETGK